EGLMATMLSGAAIMDAAILVIAANEKCPQPQTAEHLTALKILGINNVIVAQNKIDLVTKEEAINNYKDIKNFIKDSFSDAPIVPISASYEVNIDALLEKINNKISSNVKENGNLFMYVVRSFDVNKPGTKIKELKGGVIGGSILRGKVKIGDEIEIKPGIEKDGKYISIITKVVEIRSGNLKLHEARPGGLISIGTTLDPSLTKADSLVGNVVGHVNELPELTYEITAEIHLFDELTTVGKITPLIKDERIMVSVGTALRLGIVKDVKKGIIKLFSPVCVEKGQKIAIGRKFKAMWRLIGYGIIK
ncbi:MAG: translation initiation factor IF-2 subunit gamma, partial [Candidatus Altarchaeaceae archaeon]